MSARDSPPSPDSRSHSATDSRSFETIDWERLEGSRSLPPRTKALLVGIGSVLALYLYDQYVAHVYLVFEWKIETLEWLFLLSVVVFGSYVVVPATRRPAAIGRIWRRFRRRPEAVVGLLFLVVLFVGGVLGPVYRPVEQNLLHTEHPPLFASVKATSVTQCAGDVVGGRCHGTPEFPLGTDNLGRDVLALTLAGARIALYVGFITAMLIVPLATVVGLSAGYRGGLLEDVLMAGVDVQQTLPAIVLYLVLASVFSRELWLIIVLFGLFSWGTVARLVYSETKQRAESGYVLAAEGMGARRTHVARRHLLPNVSNTVVMAMAHLVPILVLTEAGIAFLGFTDIDLDSWGRIIAHGFDADFAPVWDLWWVAVPSIIALAGFVVSCKLVGDALRDALDPRGTNR